MTGATCATWVGIFILSRFATTRFSTPTAVSWMSSIIACVRPCSTEYRTSEGMATASPNAVQFIASEMLFDKSVALSAGFAFATAAKAPMRPTIVPRRPSRVATLASIAR